MTDKREMTKRIKLKGLELGYTKVGITTADDFEEYLQELMSRPDYTPFINTKEGYFIQQGARPRTFFPEGKSIVCAAYGYGDIDYPEELSQNIALAYLSRTYTPLKESSAGIRFEAFKDYLRSVGCNVYEGDIYIPARIACARAGIITYGKNNFAYTDEHGSFVILYAILVDMELKYDDPTIINACPANCNICIDACPTKAIIAPGRLHPMDCLLFNHMNTFWIREELRDKIGTYIHGCDICQKVCPRNRKILEKASKKDYFLEELKKNFDLEKVLLLDDNYYQNYLRPVMHNYIKDLNYFRRNAAIALGNTGDPSHIPALRKVLDNNNPEVRDAAQWAINKLERNQSTNYSVEVCSQ